MRRAPSDPALILAMRHDKAPWRTLAAGTAELGRGSLVETRKEPPMSPLAVALLWIVIAVTVLAALVYALAGRRRAVPTPVELTYEQGTSADPALAAFASADGGEPPTEDAIAQARLGGSRGAPELGAAPLAPQAREQTPRRIDDGHVA
jgi:hypothetical protein